MKRNLHIILSVLLVCSLLLICCQCGLGEAQALNLYGIDPITLDPAVSGEMTSHEYIVQIFSGLVCLDDNLEPGPDIARSWGISDDGKTYTFDLRKDVKFQDGRKVKAEDQCR